MPRPLLLALAVTLATKAYAIGTFGRFAPGNNKFTDQLSDVLLSGTDWIFSVGQQAQAMPLLLWRPIGYALVAAIMKVCLGTYWMWGLYILQAGLSLVAGLFVHRLILALDRGPAAAALGFVLFQWSVTLATDVLLLADSLSASLATIMLCVIGTRFLDGGYGIRWALRLGLALAACFLLRDTYVLMSAIFACVLAFCVLRTAGPRRAAMVTAAFVAPFLACYVGISAWNYARTGTAFITTQGQHGYLYAVLKVAQYEPAVFSQDTPLDRVARRGFIDYDDGDTMRINTALVQEYGMTALQLVPLMKDKFYWTLRTHPRAFLASAREKLAFSRQAVQIGDPLQQLDELDSWSNQPAFWTDWRLRIQRFHETSDPSVLDLGAAVRLVPRMVSRIFGSGLFLGFVLVLPILALWRLRHSIDTVANRRNELIVVYWLAYMAVVAIYLPVNVHARYLAPVTFIPTLGAVMLLGDARAALRKQWRSRHQ